MAEEAKEQKKPNILIIWVTTSVGTISAPTTMA
jgi:hypothetical protein